MVAALRVNSPLGGCVESVFTLATHRFFFALLVCIRVLAICLRLLSPSEVWMQKPEQMRGNNTASPIMER